MTRHAVTVVGGGVAGCAAALAAARSGVSVTLFEQRPTHQTPLHATDLLCELVGGCDLGMVALDRATGLLKAELRELGCEILLCADRARRGTNSLTVDRRRFARLVTECVEAHAAIEVVREEARSLPNSVAVIATGPTTWSPLARALHAAADHPYRFSYMGRAPVIAADRLDPESLRTAPWYPGADPSRFVPLSEEEAAELRRRIVEGERALPAELTDETVLADEAEPVERVATQEKTFRARVLGGPRGPEANIKGPALRLEPEDEAESAFELPDLLTALTPQAQQRALDAVSALAHAEIIRSGLIHRLPWLVGQTVFLPTLQLRLTPRALLAGTLTGAVGYVEALATGTVAGINAARLARGDEPVIPPEDSLTGALCRALVGEPPTDERMLQANFGMLPEHRDDAGKPKDQRRERQIETALAAIRRFAERVGRR